MSKSARAWAQKQMDRLLAKAKTVRVRARGCCWRAWPTSRSCAPPRRSGPVSIVIGTHGRTGMARFFLGSVAARVAATAPCPVLTVRANQRRAVIGAPAGLAPKEVGDQRAS